MLVAANLPPQNLGILPVVLAVAGSAALLADWLVGRRIEEQYQEWKAQLPQPIPPPPPAAPQTEAEMRTWTPEQMYAAYGPLWEAWKPAAIPTSAATEQPNWLLWAALAAAAAAGVIFVLKG